MFVGICDVASAEPCPADLPLGRQCLCIVLRQSEAGKIRFTPGAVCWDYEGTATHFQGTFAAGQKVRVEMHGITHSYDQTFANSNKIEWEFRSPSISGPDQKLLTPTADSEDGVIEATLPKSGTYTFDFSPCAMWNYYGLVRICTRP